MEFWLQSKTPYELEDNSGGSQSQIWVSDAEFLFCSILKMRKSWLHATGKEIECQDNCEATGILGNVGKNETTPDYTI